MQNQNRGDLSRQQLMRGVGALAGLPITGWDSFQCPPHPSRDEAVPASRKKKDAMAIKIANVNANFERESLQEPFGFKGAP
ncbi:MAG: hypothetical protein BRD40_04060 [Bacteroidetes bacterium QS_1_65_9]|nr:MAG: hypothetical protein BRD40_04060 [Bacteroidetes bacterium QS_1_65_9]